MVDVDGDVDVDVDVDVWWLTLRSFSFSRSSTCLVLVKRELGEVLAGEEMRRERFREWVGERGLRAWDVGEWDLPLPA